mgnify:CR=1 FL=1
MISKDDFRKKLKFTKTDIFDEIKSRPFGKLMIWGTGGVSAGATRWLKKENIDFDGYLVDSGNLKVSDDRISDKPIYETDTFLKENSDIYIIVGHSHYEKAKLLMKKYPNIKRIWTIAAIARLDILMSEEYICKNIEKLAYSYYKLSDKESRQNMIDYLNAQLSRDGSDIISHFKTSTSYFENDVINLKDNEYYFDAGVFDGKSIQSFIKNTSEKYAGILGVEIVPQYYERAKKMFAGYANVQIINAGMSDHDGVDYFDFDGESTAITTSGGTRVDVKTIDTICKENDFHPSIIKICIGNSVLPVLKGASSVLRDYTPKLIVTAGIDTKALTDYIPEIEKMSKKNAYNFYLRYETAMAERLVLYAIPKKENLR